jgi:hypothetical protein
MHRPAEFNRATCPFPWPASPPATTTRSCSYDWSLQPGQERRELLAEHGLMARGYPDVRANTVALFALSDYEWVLAFEADELHRIVDLMRICAGPAPAGTFARRSRSSPAAATRSARSWRRLHGHSACCYRRRRVKGPEYRGADGVGDPERHQVVGGEKASQVRVTAEDPVGRDLGRRAVIVGVHARDHPQARSPDATLESAQAEGAVDVAGPAAGGQQRGHPGAGQPAGREVVRSYVGARVHTRALGRRGADRAVDNDDGTQHAAQGGHEAGP